MGDVGGFQGGDFLGRKVEGEGGDGVFQMGDFGGADDGRGDAGFLGDPGEGDLGAGDASGFCDFGYRFHHFAVRCFHDGVEFLAEDICFLAFRGFGPVAG